MLLSEMHVCLPNAVGRLTIHVYFQRRIVPLWADGKVICGSILRRLRSMVLSGLNGTHVPIQLLQILRDWLGTGSRASLQILLAQNFYCRKKLKQAMRDIRSSEKDHEIEMQNGRYFIASNSAFLQV